MYTAEGQHVFGERELGVRSGPIPNGAAMKGKAKQRAGKPGGGTLLLAFAAVLFILILLLRLLVFVTPHGRPHF